MPLKRLYILPVCVNISEEEVVGEGDDAIRASARAKMMPGT
jgi:hypothetical protein